MNRKDFVKLRKETGLSIEDFAKVLSTTALNVSSIEKGKNKVSTTLINRIHCLYPHTKEWVSE